MDQPSNQARPDRIQREKQTVAAMIGVYCRARHGGALCATCRELLEYALARLDRCPFAAQKPTCAACPIHCYKPAMREQVQQVMRFAGPRMIYRHPWLALRHLLDSWRAPPPQR